MNKFELTGIIIEIFPSQTFNKGFRKREFVIEVGDKYPQKILFQLVQEKCDMLESYSIGDTVTVAASVKAHEEREGVKQTVLSRIGYTKSDRKKMKESA